MLKDILVHLDGGSEDETLLNFAEALARPFQAHITGVVVNRLPDTALLGSTDSSGAIIQVLIEMEQKARAEGDKLIAHFEQRMPRLAALTEVRRLEAGAYQITLDAASLARAADIFVMTRPYGEKADGRSVDVLESVLFSGGRSLIVVPPGYAQAGPIRRILVAWRDSRETARAISESLPLLRKATHTRLLIIDDEKRREETRSAPAADIARHLDRHGVKVEIAAADLPGRSVAEHLVKEMRDYAPDLIVMGGYGHSRFREWILGGTTREMLTRSDVPLLLAH